MRIHQDPGTRDCPCVSDLRGPIGTQCDAGHACIVNSYVNSNKIGSDSNGGHHLGALIRETPLIRQPGGNIYSG